MELVEETGQAQAEQLETVYGKKPADGFWRITPELKSERGPGTTLFFTSPEGREFRQKFPVNGCSSTTIKLFRQSLARYGFDIDAERKEMAGRARDKRQRESDAVAEKEKRLHADLAAAKPPVTVATVRKKKKVYPREEVSSADVNATYAQALLDEPGDGSIVPRPLSAVNLRRFATIIEGPDLWVPDYLYIDWFGFVVNGRHRLTAIASQDNTVACKFIWGVDPALYAICDSPKPRSGGDTLYSAELAPAGGTDHSRMASALRMLHSYKIGSPSSSWSKDRVENRFYVELAHRYPMIIEAMEVAKVLYTAGRRLGRVSYSPSPAIVFAYLAHERWPDCGKTLDEFMLGVTLGENVAGDDPRKALYNLMGSRQNTKKRGPEAAIGRVKQLALLLKMWNAYCSADDVQVATWRDGEQMPLAITESDVARD